MYGVVLWSQKDENKAVIWCEDHGDLAFYHGSKDSVFDGCSLDAGDLVSFHVSEGRDMRLATEPKLIAEQQYPGLAESLIARGASIGDGHPAMHATDTAASGSNVVRFAPRGETRRLAS
ncbi:hypothetical protein [Marimonas arenosa]|uniref:Cold shock domain-containing protein n=1 Tax=Marimonas arenosa TaxID=1795305 RepID=A0AAE3WAL7_9RHOB|nr:hypothetical protein [Marimonas arenosa]MDQ2089114.1 cold shock domain-containing protein [Marimonas arenosa]